MYSHLCLWYGDSWESGERTVEDSNNGVVLVNWNYKTGIDDIDTF